MPLRGGCRLIARAFDSLRGPARTGPGNTLPQRYKNSGKMVYRPSKKSQLSAQTTESLFDRGEHNQRSGRIRNGCVRKQSPVQLLSVECNRARIFNFAQLFFLTLSIQVFHLVDRKLATEYLAERDQRLGARQPDGLQLGVDNLEQVLVVPGEPFDNRVVLSGRSMALDHLGNFVQLLHHVLEVARILQVEPHIGTRFKPDLV